MPIIPPFPQSLENKRYDPTIDALLEGIQNLCVRMPLLQDIKEIPIYNKFIKETCMKVPGRKKKKDPIIVNVVEYLSKIMLGKVVYPKYADPRSLVVTVNIKSVAIPKHLIDLGEAINVMTKYTMLNLNLQALLRHTTTFLQMAESSIVCLEAIIEYVVVYVDSWEYPTNFIVLRTKNKFNGYPLIMGRYWLAKKDACINCRQ